MSRSWERMVQRNAKKVDKRRKKDGRPSLSAQAAHADKFLGRNYIFPILLILLMAFYVIMFAPWATDIKEDTTMFWVTLGCYALLALFYFMRRPYLTVTKDTLETRKFSGYKTLRPSEIRKIALSPGYVVIETVKGSNWVFSKFINRFPVGRMGDRLKEFAAVHRVELEVKEK
ncbi:hypothetical protein GE107_19165 [Cohnella sp. CFH 77786]|uniref:hypothetical protein n=1 Tax=Cohnella sp. CFH 77786 TaxID=2662265 RepID=UPI001C60C94D|nr:hypothetical protein [Cohnella sp. CFH 77786]MBW5448183.1 hypothetical protein [Cohnella sp. CFH 77786]